jgi:spore coat protein U-like protein
MSAVRQISGTAGSLMYGMYQDSAHSTPWGDGTNVGAGQSGFGDGNAEPFLVYAALTVPAVAAIGSYSDTVIVTVSF